MKDSVGEKFLEEAFVKLLNLTSDYHVSFSVISPSKLSKFKEYVCIK